MAPSLPVHHTQLTRQKSSSARGMGVTENPGPLFSHRRPTKPCNSRYKIVPPPLLMCLFPYTQQHRYTKMLVKYTSRGPHEAHGMAHTKFPSPPATHGIPTGHCKLRHKIAPPLLFMLFFDFKQQHRFTKILVKYRPRAPPGALQLFHDAPQVPPRCSEPPQGPPKSPRTAPKPAPRDSRIASRGSNTD